MWLSSDARDLTYRSVDDHHGVDYPLIFFTQSHSHSALLRDGANAARVQQRQPGRRHRRCLAGKVPARPASGDLPPRDVVRRRTAHPGQLHTHAQVAPDRVDARGDRRSSDLPVCRAGGGAASGGTNGHQISSGFEVRPLLRCILSIQPDEMRVATLKITDLYTLDQLQSAALTAIYVS